MSDIPAMGAIGFDNPDLRSMIARARAEVTLRRIGPLEERLKQRLTYLKDTAEREAKAVADWNAAAPLALESKPGDEALRAAFLAGQDAALRDDASGIPTSAWLREAWCQGWGGVVSTLAACHTEWPACELYRPRTFVEQEPVDVSELIDDLDGAVSPWSEEARRLGRWIGATGLAETFPMLAGWDAALDADAETLGIEGEQAAIERLLKLIALLRTEDVRPGAAPSLVATNEAAKAAELPSNDRIADSYVSATPLFAERFGGYQKGKRYLDKVPESEIRRRKPSPKRLEIHAGDWLRHWAKADATGFDGIDSAAMDIYIADAAARTAAVRSRRK